MGYLHWLVIPRKKIASFVYALGNLDSKTNISNKSWSKIMSQLRTTASCICSPGEQFLKYISKPENSAQELSWRVCGSVFTMSPLVLA